MKKISFYAVVLIIITIGTYTALGAIDKHYENKISEAYFNSFGDLMVTEKNEGLVLQKQSIKRNDNLQIFGSSELGTPDIHSNPVNMFKDKATGFQVNLIGRGFSQSLVHALAIGSLNEELKNEKLVVVLSPQWFTAGGLAQSQLEMNFSELQFYSFMFNKDIDKDLKLKLASRIASLTKGSQNNSAVYSYAALYAKDNAAGKAGYLAITPYAKFKYKLLSIKDKVQSYKALMQAKGTSQPEGQERAVQYDWDKELLKAEEIGKQKANNNSFAVENNYYDKYVKDQLASAKDSYKDMSYSESPEYEDLKLILEISKRKGLNPLFVSAPVHGKWYDYSGFSKEDRKYYYKKVSDLIKSYNFEVVDLQNHEYEEYFLKDIMHLGWKGWVYIDKAINEYYHNNR